MKQVLLGTSAIALAAALASSAQAAEWEIRIGGYMEQYLAFASSSGSAASGRDFDGIDSKQDAEIHFVPSITLDNGLKIGINVQLEGFQNNDQIDESYLFIQGSFGEILLGSENSAGYKMSYAAPDVSFLNINSGSITAFIPFSGAINGVTNVGDDVFRGTLGSTFVENDRNNDAQRFTYFSPRFAGFQLGVSYARDGLQDENQQVDCSGGTICDYFDVGANYVNSFGDFNVAISGRWGIANGAGNDPEVWGAGINLGFAGVTIGGSFAEQNNSSVSDGIAYDAGISYETGPWGFSFTYFHGENVDNENAGIGADEELDAYLLSASYDLAMGVKLSAFGAYVDFDEEVSDGGGGNGDDIDGFIIGTGIKVSF